MVKGRDMLGKAIVSYDAGETTKTVQLTNERLQHLGHYASEMTQPLHGLGRTAPTALTSAILDPAAQKAYVTGKVPHREVLTLRGSLFALEGQPITHEIAEAANAIGILDNLYRAVGGSWTVSARSDEAVDSVMVEQTEGWKVRHSVRNEADSILAALGKLLL
ncbi:hypothetical protein H6F75_14720 [Nodosilinea sp. FACHB-131]|uniref:hypothetical protein n=1 Tax=Cyanophyceae TaxID=3028117 RepID=UPI0016891EBB|nr:hypothetical protein [Nodosilinea sp. FACHB-131]MBD1874740.1 hypothetical protein [Nodosilinea sp. FACHB-131]